MKAKNIVTVIVVAVLSSLITILGYTSVSNSKLAKSFNRSITQNSLQSEYSHNEYADSFSQDKNLKLINLTTAEGYPDFTEAAAKSVDGVVHVKVKTITQQQYINNVFIAC